MDLNESMRAYVESHYPILYLVTFDEEAGDTLIRNLAGGRKVLEWNMARGFVRFDNKLPMADYKDLPAALDNWLDQDPLDNHFLIVKDAYLALRDNPLAVARLRALTHKIIYDDNVVATVFLVSSQPFVPPELEKFITIFDQPSPEEGEIEKTIQDHVAKHGLSVEEDVTSQLVLAFRGLSAYEITRLLNRAHQRDGAIGIDDIELVIDEKKQIVKKNGILEMISVTEEMGDVGGLKVLKKWLNQKAKIMADLPKALKYGVETPKGTMIVGMPGCGKSLTAKATSALLGLPLLRLDIGSLMGRYVGDSEANMRQALRLAETVSPCVLWVDELEKAFTGIGGGASGGSEVTSRLFGYFLTWMQEKTKPVFVVTTANDISALPPELLRKGRFDEIFYVDFPDEEERVEIIKVHLKKRGKHRSGLKVKQLAEKTEGFSGADLEGIVKDAIEQAFLDDESSFDWTHLHESMTNSQSHAKIMKDKADEYRKKFEEMGIRSASRGDEWLKHFVVGGLGGLGALYETR